MLTQSEIKAKAAQFAETWKNAKDEDAEAKSFWDELFLVFGTPRKNVASFEHKVRFPDKSIGKIDLLWKGKLLVEHKSLGKSLAEARKQAQEYALCLKPSERPDWIVVCDFQHFEIVNQKTGEEHKFVLKDLPKNLQALGFIGGFAPKLASPSIPVNIKAVELLGDVYDTLKAGGYPEHSLAPFLVRLLFALFADNTAIFDPDQFHRFLVDETAEDGSDLGAKLDAFFQVLDTPANSRQALLPDYLKQFPYVNGALFAVKLPNAAMNAAMRASLLKAAEFDWSQISPAIFGSLFQAVMEGAERRALGAHYTSEEDILKLIKPLFLDDLTAELDDICHETGTKKENLLDAFHARLADLRFLDPACGCGNFLIIAYRELRKLETRLLIERYKSKKTSLLDVALFVKLNVDMMYGIEIEEFPSEIAKVGMWLMDHICNTELAAAFGKSFTRLPLKKSATISCANALATDWATLLAPADASFVIGNPPFKGKKEQTNADKLEVKSAFGGANNVGNLDYVCAWYAKAADYIHGTDVRCAFVSTNSISQGEQVAELWKFLIKKHIKIDFAHRTFAWKSEARGAAHVHVVIIGFSLEKAPVKQRWLFDYSDPAHVRTTKASTINPYLVDAPTVLVESRKKPLSASAPPICYGSMMIDKERSAGDDEGLVFSEAVRKQILAENAALSSVIKVIYGGKEFINGEERYCLWAPDGDPALIKTSQILKDRIARVKQFRLSSGRPQTVKAAATPYRFGEVRQPSGRYIFVPKVSSMRRRYIPLGFVDADIIASGSALIVTSTDLFDFGVLHSAMHNSWMRAVAGRMKSDYQYSADIVYNNFCWPDFAGESEKKAVRDAAQKVLDARKSNASLTLAEMYDPELAPANLVAAHDALDKAVDNCYRKQPFATEVDRIQFLFGLYDKATSPLGLKAAKAKPSGKTKKKK